MSHGLCREMENIVSVSLCFGVLRLPSRDSGARHSEYRTAIRFGVRLVGRNIENSAPLLKRMSVHDW